MYQNIDTSFVSVFFLGLICDFKVCINRTETDKHQSTECFTKTFKTFFHFWSQDTFCLQIFRDVMVKSTVVSALINCIPLFSKYEMSKSSCRANLTEISTYVGIVCL